MATAPWLSLPVQARQVCPRLEVADAEADAGVAQAVLGKGSASSYYAGSSTVVVNPALLARQAVRERLTPDANGIVLVMVGLPARGKSFISRKLERFLQWRGSETKQFNVGKYRRAFTAVEQSGRSNFFDFQNTSALEAREAAATAALVDALSFLDGGGRVAVLDATNSTSARRRRIVEQVSTHTRTYSVVFLEAICDDEEVVKANMAGKCENSPDFVGMSLNEAVADLRNRIAKYEAVYESVQDHEGAYIKLFNLSSKVMVNHCYGRIARSVLPYTMAIHIGCRPIWLVRAGAGEANPQSPSDRMSELSHLGRSFALSLATFVKDRAAGHWQHLDNTPQSTQVFTSTLPRAVESVSAAFPDFEQTSKLNPIDKGGIGVGWWDVECPSDVPAWDEVERRHPEFYAQWRKDPLRCRFPAGESYMDVIKRLEALLLEVEACTSPVLIVTHMTVLQLLVAYFRGLPVEQAWEIPFSKHTVFEVVPTSGGGFACAEHRLAVDEAPAAKRFRRE